MPRGHSCVLFLPLTPPAPQTSVITASACGQKESWGYNSRTFSDMMLYNQGVKGKRRSPSRKKKISEQCEYVSRTFLHKGIFKS